MLSFNKLIVLGAQRLEERGVISGLLLFAHPSCDTVLQRQTGLSAAREAAELQSCV